MEAVENGPLSDEKRAELLKTRRDGLNARRSLSEANLRLVEMCIRDRSCTAIRAK